MKHESFRRLTSALCALVMLLALVPAAQAAGSSAVSDNINGNSYPGTGAGGGYWATTVKSYLYENASGGLTRVEYIGDGKIVAEDYSSSFQFQSSRAIPFELSLWGGFFAGETYNFFIFGQNNLGESDGVEVIRVVKYDKSWNRLGQASVYGADTYQTFRAGSLRCTETGGNLYIHTCHEMYKSSDGKNHQSNMNIVVRESDMALLQNSQGTSNYVSHSFNQFILADQLGNIVTLDHGDGYPRALVVHQCPLTPYGETRESNVWEFPGKIGGNATNGTVGALAETSTGYLTAYNHDDYPSGWASRKVYLGYTDKNTMASRSVPVSSVRTLSAPHLAPTSLEGGWILFNGMDSGHWYVDDTLYYAAYNASGEVGEVHTVLNVPLSDCAPIQYNGKTVWYTTDESTPVFYTLDNSGVRIYPTSGGSAPGAPAAAPSAPPALPSIPSVLSGNTSFRDVSSGHWAYHDIMACAELGIVSGFEDGTFRPEDKVTGTQLIVMLTRTFYADKLAGVTAPAGEPWYYPNTKAAEDIGLFKYTKAVDSSPITRYEMSVVLDNVRSISTDIHTTTDMRMAAERQIKDYSEFPSPSNYFLSVVSCYAFGILSGMDDGCFHGEQNMTRAQACAVIVRMIELFNG